MTLVSYAMDDLYRKLSTNLMQAGNIVKVRGLETRELLNTQLVLTNPQNRFIGLKSRAMDMRYFVGELCYFLDCRIDLASIAYYSKFWNHVSDNGKTVNSAYGARLFGEPSQLSYIVNVLTNDQYSRKAVMTIYDEDDSKASNDNPCTMNIQFIIRENQLYCFVNMRSNDAWLGVPYDVAFFTIVQEIVFTELKLCYPALKLGNYYHNVVSMHVYEKNYQEFKLCTFDEDAIDILAPSLTDVDVFSWFNDLLTYEKAYRKVVLYKHEDRRTDFQDWCKSFLV